MGARRFDMSDLPAPPPAAPRRPAVRARRTFGQADLWDVTQRRRRKLERLAPTNEAAAWLLGEERYWNARGYTLRQLGGSEHYYRVPLWPERDEEEARRRQARRLERERGVGSRVVDLGLKWDNESEDE